MDGPWNSVRALAASVADTAHAAGLSDGQLLEHFATRQEERAFAELLQRHGPMVWGVCRRILRDGHEADDAFQATFLVLVRKAGSIAKRESVASWLYGVACRVAVKAKSRQRRRRAFERQAVNRVTADPYDEILWRDLRPVLDEEVNRLPKKYRRPVVLCFVERKAYSEAARLLGCSKGTIALRLAQARELLRRRLTRRGVVMSLAVLTALLGRDEFLLPVPSDLSAATADAALLWANSGHAGSTVSAPIGGLAEDVLSALMWAKLRIAVVMVAMLCVGGSGVGLMIHGLGANPAAVESDGAVLKKGKKSIVDESQGLQPRRRADQ